MKLEPISEMTGSLADRAYTSLREAILNNQAEPGTRLRKDEIADEFGVSRAPISEAIQRLAQEGLVEVRPQSGSFVSKMSMNGIREAIFIRQALELAAVEHFAEHHTEAQLVELESILNLQEFWAMKGNQKEFHDADVRMHTLFLESTGLSGIVGVAETAWSRVERARRMMLPKPGRIKDTLKEHQDVADAVRARAPEASRNALKKHLSQLPVLLDEFRANKPELFE